MSIGSWSKTKWAFVILNYVWFAASLVVAWFFAPFCGDLFVGVAKEAVRIAKWMADHPYDALWWIGATVGFVGWSYWLEEVKVWIRDRCLRRLRARATTSASQ